MLLILGDFFHCCCFGKNWDKGGHILQIYGWQNERKKGASGLLCLRFWFSVFVWTLVLVLVFLNVCMDSCACACVSQCLYGLLCLRLRFSVFV